MKVESLPANAETVRPLRKCCKWCDIYLTDEPRRRVDLSGHDSVERVWGKSQAEVQSGGALHRP